MRLIWLDNVSRVKYRDSLLMKGWLTHIHVIFTEPGQTGNYSGPGLRLALYLLEDQFRPEDDFERQLVEWPVPSPVDFEIDPKTLKLSAPHDRLQGLPPDQLIAAQEQAKQFGYFLSEGRPFNVEGLLGQIEGAMNGGKQE
jgi:hypothetical protein